MLPATIAFSRFAGSLPESQTLAITARAKRMKAEGVDVAPFAAGEPDFDTPEHVKEAGLKAIRDGRTKYAPAAGIPALREAVAAKFRANGLEGLTPDRTLICAGAKGVLFQALQALLQEGDEVIVPTPAWLSYPQMIHAVGGRTVFVDTAPADALRDRPREGARRRHAALARDHPELAGQPHGGHPARRGAGRHRPHRRRARSRRDQRRDLRAHGLRARDLHLVRDGGARGRGPDAARERRLEGVRHDRLADRLRRRPEGPDGPDGATAEPRLQRHPGDLPAGRARRPDGPPGRPSPDAGRVRRAAPGHVRRARADRRPVLPAARRRLLHVPRRVGLPGPPLRGQGRRAT